MNNQQPTNPLTIHSCTCETITAIDHPHCGQPVCNLWCPVHGIDQDIVKRAGAAAKQRLIANARDYNETTGKGIKPRLNIYETLNLGYCLINYWARGDHQRKGEPLPELAAACNRRNDLLLRG